jgi:hypothetical protein
MLQMHFPGGHMMKLLPFTRSLSANQLGWMMSELVTLKIHRPGTGYKNYKTHQVKKGDSRYKMACSTFTRESGWEDLQICSAKSCMLFTQASLEAT